MCKAIERAAGPQLFGVWNSYGGDGSDTCVGKGSGVAEGGDVGVPSV
jgi:hypothetical protein